ncbi:RNA polymerase subunit sigma-24 [uncultured Oscillibacter sp.]|uniref:RNA polymerase subunit sigma-24 n=1 Tax=uncultured Oscillibacter sp. TaxID=876091 RepID=UPI0025ECF71E|nr:RNA polymerase subunit sigma-24 [uncultured Oscillibacter sp.]
MKIINLRFNYPHCQQDKLVKVSEEVFDVLCQSVREMRNHERRKRYHRAYYSLDAYAWTENYALEHSPSPEQFVMLAEERAECNQLAAALREALTYATPTQAHRIRAYYLGGLTQQQIADRERVHNSNVCLSIRRGLCNLRRYYADHHLGK